MSEVSFKLLSASRTELRHLVFESSSVWTFIVKPHLGWKLRTNTHRNLISTCNVQVSKFTGFKQSESDWLFVSSDQPRLGHTERRWLQKLKVKLSGCELLRTSPWKVRLRSSLARTLEWARGIQGHLPSLNYRWSGGCGIRRFEGPPCKMVSCEAFWGTCLSQNVNR